MLFSAPVELDGWGPSFGRRPGCFERRRAVAVQDPDRTGIQVRRSHQLESICLRSSHGVLVGQHRAARPWLDAERGQQVAPSQYLPSVRVLGFRQVERGAWLGKHHVVGTPSGERLSGQAVTTA